MTPINITQVLTWQYNDATRLQSLIEKHQVWIDRYHNQFWTDWYDDVFNLETANDFGLSVWAIILGVSFGVELSDGTKNIFGFSPYGDNFFASNFSAVASGAVQLTTEQKRTVLKLRYYQMTSRATIPEINAAVRAIFGSAWVLDPGDMSFVYIVMGGTPTSEQQFIIDNFDVIPRPSGVGIAYRYNIESAFGFAPYGQNFYNSIFAGG